MVFALKVKIKFGVFFLLKLDFFGKTRYRQLYLCHTKRHPPLIVLIHLPPVFSLSCIGHVTCIAFFALNGTIEATRYWHCTRLLNPNISLIVSDS
jgi:hypothetical protein